MSIFERQKNTGTATMQGQTSSSVSSVQGEEQQTVIVELVVSRSRISACKKL